MRRARKYGIGVPLAMSPSKPHQFQPDTRFDGLRRPPSTPPMGILTKADDLACSRPSTEFGWLEKTAPAALSETYALSASSKT